LVLHAGQAQSPDDDDEDRNDDEDRDDDDRDDDEDRNDDDDRDDDDRDDDEDRNDDDDRDDDDDRNDDEDRDDDEVVGGLIVVTRRPTAVVAGRVASASLNFTVSANLGSSTSAMSTALYTSLSSLSNSRAIGVIVDDVANISIINIDNILVIIDLVLL